MLTITLTPELEKAATERAEQQGTTAELIALDSLRRQLLPAPSASSSPDREGSLADFLGDFVGCLHSSENIPGGAQMSTDSSKKFAKGMMKNRAEGRL
jgi:hypothetical protein